MNYKQYVDLSVLSHCCTFTLNGLAMCIHPDLFVFQENCGLTVCDGKVYILGGRDEFEAVTDRTWAFDPLSGQLTEEMPLTHSLSHHGCVTITQHLQHK